MWTENTKIEKLGRSNKVRIHLEYKEAKFFTVGKDKIPADKKGRLQFETVNPGVGSFTCKANGEFICSLAYPQLAGSYGVFKSTNNKKPIPANPVLVKEEPIINSVKCSELSNHHSYYDGANNTVLGTFIGVEGQVNIDDEWIDTSILGTLANGDTLRGYRKKTTNLNQKISIRAKENCPVITNVTTIRNTGEISSKVELPLSSLQMDKYSPAPFNLPFIHFADITTSNNVKNIIFGLSGIHNISMRVDLVNSYGSIYLKEKNLTTCAIMTVNKELKSASLITNKDFILELKDNNKNETYCFAVRGSSLGGLNSSTYTITCLKSNKVFVSTYLGNPEVKTSITLEDGTVIDSIDSTGQSFMLPNALEKNEKVYFGFETNKKWCKIHLLNKDNI